MTAARPSPELLLAHADFVRALARGLLADAHAAEDVAQESLAAALARPPRAAAGLRAWLGRVTRNAARQRLRAEGRRAAREQDAARRDVAPGAAEVAEREATRAAVVRAVLALPEPSRGALLLRYYEGLPPRAIAARLGVPVETVRTRIKRGLARLRAALEEQDGDGRAWMQALVPLAGGAGALPAPGGAALAAGTGAKVAAAAAVVVAAGALAWRTRPPSPAAAPVRVAGLERGGERAALEAGAPVAPAGDAARPDRAASPEPAARAARAAAGVGAARVVEDPAAAAGAPAVSLGLEFVDPRGAAVALGPATIELADGRDATHAVEHAGGATARVDGLTAGSWALLVRGDGFRHRGQRLELGAERAQVERCVVWPDGWVAVVARTSDGRPFTALADELSIEPVRLFVGAFEVRARTDPPDDASWSAGAGGVAAVWSPPPGWQAFELPGAAIGSLELLQPPPLWVGLALHGVPLGWRPLRPGESELEFTLDAADLERRFARLTLRVLDAPGGAPRLDARAELKADTSAHRRRELADLAPDAQGRITFERVVPGRHGLIVDAGDALVQQRLELAPGEERDLGQLVLPVGAGLPLRVVDAAGAPVRAWIEIAPFVEGGAVAELFHPNLHRLSDAQGRYLLPLPAGPSIVRATLADGRELHPTDRRSPIVRVDPAALPGGELTLVVRDPLAVEFTLLEERALALEVRDALGLVVARLAGGDAARPPRAKLVPGSYRARLVGLDGRAFGAAEFALVDRPLVVVLP